MRARGATVGLLLAIALAMVALAGAARELIDASAAGGQTSDPAAIGGPDASAGCSIRAMAAREGIHIDVIPAQPPGVARAIAQLQREVPEAVIVEELVGILHSTQSPPVDGRTAVILRAEGATMIPAGPVPGNPVAVPVACGLWIYDAFTGDFIEASEDSGP